MARAIGWRMVPLWAVALFAGVFVATVVLVVVGGSARAQQTGSVEALAADAADLSVTKTVHPKLVTVGANQTFTIKITNERRDTARNVVMRDPLPSEVQFIRASTSRHKPGSCSAQSGTVTCELGNLRVDQTVTVDILVRTVKAGRYTNKAFVSHATLELDRSDDQDGARSRVTRG